MNLRKPHSRKPRSDFARLAACGWALAVCLLTVPVHAQTVALELRNGDHLSGVILSENISRVVVSNAWNREIILPFDQIVRRTVLAARSSATPTNSLPSFAILTAPKPTQTNAPKRWTGQVEVGLDVLHSTSTRDIFHGRAKLTYVKDRFRNVTDLSGAYGRTDGVVDADRVDGANKIDFDLKARWYVYNQAWVGYDHVRKIDLGYEEGAGVGYHLWKSATFVENVELGFDYHAEDRTDNQDMHRFYGRLGENGSWKINRRLFFDHRIEYLPSVEDASQYRLRGEANLRYALIQNLSFNLTLLDSYDTAPAQGVTPNDLQIRSSVGVKF